MNTRTTTRATLIASAVLALMTTNVGAQEIPAPRAQAPIASSWFSGLWALLGDGFRCSRCHDRTR